MLAGDPIETTEQAQSFLKDRPLTDYYEQIMMGALRLAWADLQRGRLDQQEAERIRSTVSELVEDLESSDTDSRREVSEDRVASAKLKQVGEVVSAEAPLSPRPIGSREPCFAFRALDRSMKPWRCRSPSCCAVEGDLGCRERDRDAFNFQTVWLGTKRRRAHLSLLPGARDAGAIALRVAPLTPEGTRRPHTGRHFQRNRAADR